MWNYLLVSIIDTYNTLCSTAATCGKWVNLSGFYTNASHYLKFHPKNYLVPESIPELQEIIRSSKCSLHAVGKGHSFNNCIESSGLMIDTTRLTRISISKKHKMVLAEAGITIMNLSMELFKEGYELYDVPGYINQTIAGAINTGTHGTIRGRGQWTTTFEDNLVSLAIVNFQGKLQKISVKDAVLSDGFGIIVQVVLRIRPVTYWRFVHKPINVALLSQDVIEKICDRFDYPDINFNGEGRAVIEYLHPSKEPGLRELGAYLAKRAVSGEFAPKLMAPLVGFSKRDVVAGKFKNAKNDHIVTMTPALPFFIANSSQYAVKSLQIEWVIPFDRTAEALKLVSAMEKNTYYNILIRFQGKTCSRMNPSHGLEKSTYIHLTTLNEQASVDSYNDINAAMMELGARVHWGKAYELAPGQLKSVFNFKAYIQTCQKYDPESRFMNRHLKRLIVDNY